MVYVWTGLTEAIGLRYYGVPGIDVDPDVAFQYREPSEQDAFMKREEYDEFTEDPTRFLYETWLPRVVRDVSAKGQPTAIISRSSKAAWPCWTIFGMSY